MLNVSNPATDTTAVKDKIKKFVEQYNSTIDLIRTKLSEQKVKDPKTDTDRAKGVLYNDSMLNGLLQRLRSSIGAAVRHRRREPRPAREIGITTGSRHRRRRQRRRARRQARDRRRQALRRAVHLAD